MKPILFLLFILLSTPVLAQEPMSNAPHDNPMPGEFGAGNAALTGARPPSFPPYLPNGAINLEDAWIQDGGARLYWNYVIVPRQVKMGGAYWVDPALVPQLVIQPNKQPVRRYRAPRARAVKSPAPANASSTALKSPAIPLPVEPAPVNTVVPAPFSPTQARQATGIVQEAPSQLQPPRLQ